MSLGVDFSTNVTDDFIRSIMPTVLQNLMASNNNINVSGVSYPAAVDMVFQSEVPQMNGSVIIADNITACVYNISLSVLSNLNAHSNSACYRTHAYPQSVIYASVRTHVMGFVRNRGLGRPTVTQSQNFCTVGLLRTCIGSSLLEL